MTTLCALGACAPSAHSAHSAQARSPIEPPGAAAGPLRLAAAPSAPSPSWLQAPGPLVDVEPGPAKLLAVGQRISLHRTRHGVMIVDLERGVLGRMPIPEGVVWVGVDGQDMIWGATRRGQLTRQAPSDALTGPQPTARVADIPGASAWDVSGDHVMVATGATLHLSEDRGQTWSQVTLAPDLILKQVFARADGALVALGLRGQDPHTRHTWLRPPGQRDWVVSGFQPEQLRRDGAWIWSGDPSCVATLASDGLTWSADPSLEDLPGHRDAREAMLRLVWGEPPQTQTTQTQRTQTQTTQTHPPAPAPPPAALQHRGRQPSCQDPIPTSAALERARALQREQAQRERGLAQPACQGAGCLLQATPEPVEPAGSTFALWQDGRCDATRCERQPHGVLIIPDQDRVSTLALPQGCRPRRLWSARGLGLLRCGMGPGRADLIFARTTDQGWQPELELPADAALMASPSMASDGTLVLHGECGLRGCHASWLRLPAELTRSPGPASAWRRLASPDALWATPVQGGRALVLASPLGDRPHQVQLWLHDAQRHQALASVDLRGESLRGAQILEDGRIALLLGDELVAQPWIADADGSLSPAR